MDSRRALIEALNDYTGAVILISHDRNLIEATVDRLWVVNKGTVSVFEGDMDEYRDLVVGTTKKGKKAKQAEAAAAAAAAVVAPEPEKPVEARPRINPAVLRKKVDDLHTLMAKIERLIQGIDTELGDTSIYAKNPSRAAELTKARANAARKLADTEEEWLLLSGDLEEMAG
jgi:ATP-binding cassette subfamily F protein 3